MNVGEIIFWATVSYAASAVLRVNWRIRMRRVIKPFHLHQTVTPTVSANTTLMHKCQRSGLASTAVHTFYSAVCKENSTQHSTQGVSSPLCISKLQWINNQQWQSKNTTIFDHTIITNVMNWILFICKIILLSSTCFEYQVLIFRRT